jgi:mono/diheme cytochrome c family protein
VRAAARGAVRRLLGCGCLGGALALSGCHRLAAPKPLDELNAQERRGHVVFEARCAQCHYDREDESLHGPSLKGVFQKPYLKSGAPANDERVTATILHGHGLMPAQPGMDPEDVEDLLTYLHTL